MLLSASIGELANTEKIIQVFSRDLHLRQHFFKLQTLDHFAANLGEFPLQGSNSSLPGVVANDVKQRVFPHLQFRLFDAVVLELFRQQIFQGDVGFLVFGVA